MNIDELVVLRDLIVHVRIIATELGWLAKQAGTLHDRWDYVQGELSELETYCNTRIAQGVDLAQQKARETP